jgi:DNA-binding NarL/FixJ family response regulator
MSEKIKIIIADDHPIFRNGLKQIISDDGDISVIGEAGDGEKALQLIKELSPDIAVLDLHMPEKNGLQILKDESVDKKKTKFVFLTMHKEEDVFNEAMEQGVKGYVLKESATNDIVDCIRTVFRNQYYISPLISGYLIKRRESLKELEASKPALNKLTPAELKILKLIAENKTSREIAEELYISYRTVENHRTNISSKLNLHGSHSLIKFAIKNKSLL